MHSFMSKSVLSACAAFALALVPSCRSGAEASSGAGGHEYVLMVLKAPDQPHGLEKEAVQEAMKGHMANIERLAETGELLVAGPFGKDNPKPERRGIFVFDGGDVAHARELTATDPAVKAGLLAMEAYPLRSKADLHRAVEVDRRFRAERKPGGPKSGEPYPMHEYVLAIVGGGEEAGRALGTLKGKGVVFSGELGGALDGSHLVFVDAKDVAAATSVLEPARGRLGDVDASPWWASAALLELAR
jgi:uncharacterized protein YciI